MICYTVLFFSPRDGDILSVEYVTYNVTKSDVMTEDQETLIFDQVSGDMYVVQKNHNDSSANIYRFTPTDEDSEIEAELVGELCREQGHSNMGNNNSWATTTTV